MAVHQYETFCNGPHLVQERAVRRITKYLASTSKYLDFLDIKQQLTTCGVVYKPDIGKVIKWYVDSDFYGGWAQSDADNAENIMSCTGYVITYTVCPVLCCSKLQT